MDNLVRLVHHVQHLVHLDRVAALLEDLLRVTLPLGSHLQIVLHLPERVEHARALLSQRLDLGITRKRGLNQMVTFRQSRFQLRRSVLQLLDFLQLRGIGRGHGAMRGRGQRRTRTRDGGLLRSARIDRHSPRIDSHLVLHDFEIR